MDHRCCSQSAVPISLLLYICTSITSFSPKGMLSKNTEINSKPKEIQKMACNWSAENATKAYLRALKMGKRGKVPDVSEFISAMAAGNNAQLTVMVSSGDAGSTTLAPVAAARQTGGRVVCIEYSAASEKGLGSYADSVKFVVGDAKTLLQEDYKGADFVLIDCNIADHKGVFRAAQEGPAASGLIVGYNAFHKGSWSTEFKTHFLPIGEGLKVTRVGGTAAPANKVGGGSRKRSRWIVKVDKWTGEEHVFSVTAPLSKEIKAK